MKLYVYTLATGDLASFKTDDGHVLIAELTDTDRDNIARMSPTATLFAVATAEENGGPTKDELIALLARIKKGDGS